MIINLCYKSYEAKLNLSACKSFYEQTGKDLHFTLLRFLSDCRGNIKATTEERLLSLFGLEDKPVIAKLLHCMIKECEPNIPLAEIEDAMYRVSWMPSDRDDELSEPWPLVVVQIATQVSEYYSELDKKKVTT